MENPTKETVIIVHGTWAAPSDNNADHVSWYQILPKGSHDRNFVSRLNDALEKRGSPARCWAHCKDNSAIFTWSGENAWFERTRAAWLLADHINKLQAEGWRCHVVAHSHGGNVIAEALPLLEGPTGEIPTIDRPSGLTGTLATLGTPFVDAISPIADKISRRSKVYGFVAWSFFSIFLLGLLLIAYVTGGWILAAIPLLAVCGLALAVSSLPKGKVRKGWKEYWTGLSKQTALRPFMLSISSPLDEGWQLLHHIRDIPNPLAPKSGLMSYLWNSEADYLRRSCEIARVNGIALFPDQSLLTKFLVVGLWLMLLVATAGVGFYINREYNEEWLPPGHFEAACNSDVVVKNLRASGNAISDSDLKYLYYIITTPKELIPNILAGLPEEEKKKLQKAVDNWQAGLAGLSPEEKEKIQTCSHNMAYTRFFRMGFISWIPILCFLFVITFFTFILGRSFYSASAAPLRWLARQLRATGQIFNHIATYVARRRSWSLLQETAFGLEEYSFELPMAQREPMFASPALYQYKDLPEGAEQRALARRDEWVKSAFRDVTQTLSKMAAPDLSALLKMVETDLSLVHAAYYTDDECIEMIADWIAGRVRSAEVEGASSDAVRLAS